MEDRYYESKIDKLLDVAFLFPNYMVTNKERKDIISNYISKDLGNSEKFNNFLKENNLKKDGASLKKYMSENSEEIARLALNARMEELKNEYRDILSEAIKNKDDEKISKILKKIGLLIPNNVLFSIANKNQIDLTVGKMNDTLLTLISKMSMIENKMMNLNSQKEEPNRAIIQNNLELRKLAGKYYNMTNSGKQISRQEISKIASEMQQVKKSIKENQQKLNDITEEQKILVNEFDEGKKEIDTLKTESSKLKMYNEILGNESLLDIYSSIYEYSKKINNVEEDDHIRFIDDENVEETDFQVDQTRSENHEVEDLDELIGDKKNNLDYIDIDEYHDLDGNDINGAHETSTDDFDLGNDENVEPLDEKHEIKTFKEITSNLLEKIKSSNFIHKAKKALVMLSIAGATAIAGVGLVNSLNKTTNENTNTNNQGIESFQDGDNNFTRNKENLRSPLELEKVENDGISKKPSSISEFKENIINQTKEESQEEIIGQAIETIVKENKQVYGTAADAINNSNGLNQYNTSWESAVLNGTDSIGKAYILDDGALKQIPYEEIEGYQNNGYDVGIAVENDDQTIGFIRLDSPSKTR